MTDYIFTQRRDIPRDMLSGILATDEGAAKLEIQAYYSKDHRPRGLKIAIYRTLETSFGYSYDLMNRHNGLVHIADFARKPSPKVAAEWAAKIDATADAIAEIALASDSPDWNAVKEIFK